MDSSIFSLWTEKQKPLQPSGQSLIETNFKRKIISLSLFFFNFWSEGSISKLNLNIYIFESLDVDNDDNNNEKFLLSLPHHLALSHKRHIHIHMYTHTLPISVSGIHPLTAQSQMEIIIDIVSLQISHISFVSWFLGSTCKAHLECVSFSPFILYHTIQATLISPNQTFCSYSSLLPPLALPPTCRVIFSEL